MPCHAGDGRSCARGVGNKDAPPAISAAGSPPLEKNARFESSVRAGELTVPSDSKRPAKVELFSGRALRPFFGRRGREEDFAALTAVPAVAQIQGKIRVLFKDRWAG